MSFVALCVGVLAVYGCIGAAAGSDSVPESEADDSGVGWQFTDEDIADDLMSADACDSYWDSPLDSHHH